MLFHIANCSLETEHKTTCQEKINLQSAGGTLIESQFKRIKIQYGSMIGCVFEAVYRMKVIDGIKGTSIV